MFMYIMNNLKEVHDSWKQKGFPYYPTDSKWRNEMFNQLITFQRDKLVDRKYKIIVYYIILYCIRFCL